MERLNISFPHMGNYYVPIKKLFESLFPGQNVFAAPPVTKKTVQTGSRHSPDFICSPFKYNVGNYIETLEKGANVLLQTGMGCRYGYYGELQEQILRDLGYEFEFLCFSRERARLMTAYKSIKKLGSSVTFSGFLKALLCAVIGIRIMDSFEYYMRENLYREAVKGSFKAAHRELLSDIANADSIAALATDRIKYHVKARQIPLRKISDPIRIGIVGELYTIMEPFSNFYVEDMLAESGISVSRKMSVSFLLFGKHDGATMRKVKGYLRYHAGANGIDSVAQAKRYARLGYDGVIHMKSFGCTPELNATPALMKIGRDYGIPILHLSFDSHTGETGVRTRLEAFVDIIIANALKNRNERNKRGDKTGGSGSGYWLHIDKGRGARRA